MSQESLHLVRLKGKNYIKEEKGSQLDIDLYPTN